MMPTLPPDLAWKFFSNLPQQAALLDSAGNILMVNHAWRAFGKERGNQQDSVGQNFFDVCNLSLQKDDGTLQEILEKLHLMLTGNLKVFRHIFPFSASDDDLWFEVSGTGITVNGVHFAIILYRDVTDETLATRMQKTTMRAQANLLHNIQDGIMAFDTAGRIIFWSKGAQTMFGYDKADVWYQPAAMLYPLANQHLFLEKLSRAASGNTIVDEHPLYTKNGKEIWVDFYLAPVTDNENQLEGYVAVFRDITEKRSLLLFLEKQNSYHEALHRIVHHAVSFNDEDSLLSYISQTIMSAIRPDSLTLFMLETDGQSLNAIQKLPKTTTEDNPKRIILGHGVVGTVALTKKRLRIDKLQSIEGYVQANPKMVSGLCVPILAQNDELIGVIYLESLTEAYFTTEEEYFLAILAAQSATAILRIHADLDRRRHLQHLKTINDIGMGLTTILSLNKVFNKILAETRTLVGAKSVAILLPEGDSRLRFIAGNGDQIHNILDHSIPQNSTAPGQVWQSGQPLLLADCRGRVIPLPENQNFQIASFMAAPIRLNNRIIGVLAAIHDKENTFNQEILSLLEYSAVWAAIAINNAQLFEKSEQDLTKIKSLGMITQALTQTRNIKQLLQLIVDESLKILPDAEHAVIHTLNDKGDLVAQAITGDTSDNLNLGYVMRAGEGIAGIAIQSLEPIIIADTHKDSRYLSLGNTFHLHSLLVCPIILHGNALGTLSLQGERAGIFNESHLEIIQLFSQQAATALDNAHHFEIEFEKRAQAAELQKLAEEALGKERAYRESELARSSAEAANQAKSVFLANMSHELRTPLNGISGYIQLLKQDASLNSKQKSQVEIIAQSSDHLLNLINGILTLSKIEAGEMELLIQEVNVQDLISGITQMFRQNAKQKNVNLMAEISPDVPVEISTDETKLRQILINLIGNALKFTNEGHVSLLVSMKVDEINRFICFHVEDTGIGIHQAHQKNLFESLTISKAISKAEGGAGLGLMISRQYVQLMGGDIGFTSEENKGSTFWLQIPCIPSSAEQKDMEEVSFEEIDYENLSNIRILVVDDNGVSLELLNRVLVQRGFNVRMAHNGVEAIQTSAEWQPHFIFMDLRMPEIDGFMAAKKIHAQQLETKPIIIAVTASVFESEADDIAKAGFQGLIPKPYKLQHIFDVIHKYSAAILDSENKKTRILAPNSLSPVQANELLNLIASGHTKQAIKCCLNIQKENRAVGTFLIESLEAYRFDFLLKLLNEYLQS